MLLRPAPSPPPPPRFPAAAARRSAAPAAAAAPFFLVLRRRQRRRRHRPYTRLRASLSDILASIPSSLALVGPAAAAAAAAVVSSIASPSSYLRSGIPPPSPSGSPDHEEDDAPAGEWILFTSPTPFNRCVLLRCPSVSFEDGGVLLDGVNERLLTQDRHYVNLSRGSIPAAPAGQGAGEVSYQRLCIPLDDGGVIALDWPANLDLDKEHGLDSTVLVVPGTPEGSMDRGIEMFVLDALKNGYFPIVMNPRGCGGSPLTTPRLFTAADSDDICTTIRFINSKRPWTTIMGVGWGYGANMLTKYLVEAGESTPLTAAVCIDNPFDLQEATRTFPHNIALDQKLTAGLVDILRANKELFQGKDKDFDVQKALSANCLRDFDGAISMVSHGFANVDDFYSKNSVRPSIAGVKIPVLFIQSDDGTVPLLSVPRSSISENPFTSLLLCSCVHSTGFTFERYTELWCQNLTLEWLSAVEFALLKGRHPLIKDVDITVNPSKGLAFAVPQPTDKKVPKEDNFHEQAQFILSHGLPHGINGLLADPTNRYSGAQNSENELLTYSANGDSGSRNSENGLLTYSANGDSGSQNSESGLLKDNGVGRISKEANEEEPEEIPEDVEQGHVLQSAGLVMNMLDATMPGTLDDDQKKKVMMAVGQGESLVKALEEAVPEDVRGKLTSSVTEILQSKRHNFNLDALKRGWTNARSNTKKVVQEKVKESDHESGVKDAKILDHNRGITSIGEVDQKDTNLTSNDNNAAEGIDLSQVKPYQASGPVGTGSEMGSEQTQLDKSEEDYSGVNESSEEKQEAGQGSVTDPKHLSDDPSTANSNGTPRERVQSADATAEQNPQSNVVDDEVDAVHANEDKVALNVVDQSTQISKTEESKHPSVNNVRQALDALTDFDDSTQMAVNSVFGVIENMIDQFQKHNDSQDRDNSNGATDKPSVDETESDVMVDVDNELSGKDKNPSSSGESKHNTSVKARPIMSEDHNFSEKKSELSTVPPSEGKIRNSRRNIPENYVDGDVAKMVSGSPDYLLDIAANSYLKVQYALYLHENLSRQLQLQSPDLNSATDLFLDPQEGKWKLADQMDNVQGDISISGKYSFINKEIKHADSSQAPTRAGNVILPPHSALRNFVDSETKRKVNEKLPGNALRQTLIYFITDDLTNTLKTEVGRKLGITKAEKLQRRLAHDVERLATQVSRTIVHDSELYRATSVQRNPTTVKFGVVHGENVVEAVSTAVRQSHDLRNVLPVGVIVGVTLASLRNYFHVGVSKHDNLTKAAVKSGILDEDVIVQDADEGNIDNLPTQKEANADLCRQEEANTDYYIQKPGEHKQHEIMKSDGKGMMVGAVTAALGASALVAHHQQKNAEEHDSMDSTQHNLAETELEKSQNNLVSSFAEKAMSVAAPVVPKKGDGELDHDRLVAVLAELGQRGGILKFVGKIALLWGGIRGALSLTDRLILFLRISERPLFQRIMGFSLMVLVLWSPVVIPLLPTLVQSWTISASTGIVGDACIVGLYVSIMILVMLWGKRIRGYENPVEQYGMNLASPSRLQEFFQGLVGGVSVVWLVHSISILLGFATFREGTPSLLPFDLLKSSSNVLLPALRGFITATSIAVVEEVVFRSWLPEEVAVDLGYYNAIMMSGVAFSLIHRSLPSVPGFVLLSLTDELCYSRGNNMNSKQELFVSFIVVWRGSIN
ncbi:hypothetical protein ZWY2020_038844 [Hordeum vulgare]|nr:hypothetical protein ZWY2020_038844 [Hordeum vulgare]